MLAARDRQRAGQSRGGSRHSSASRELMRSDPRRTPAGAKAQHLPDQRMSHVLSAGHCRSSHAPALWCLSRLILMVMPQHLKGDLLVPLSGGRHSLLLPKQKSSLKIINYLL